MNECVQLRNNTLDIKTRKKKCKKVKNQISNYKRNKKVENEQRKPENTT